MPRFLLTDLGAAAALLTRLPLPVLRHVPARTAASAWCFPLVGAGIGLAAGAVAAASLAAGLPAGPAAALALVAGAALTGALHEDGLADTADGFWGGWSVERRLEIMKDSRSGVYGVLAVVLSVLLRWSALTALLDSGPAVALAALAAAGALSRAGMAALWAWLPPARPDGLSQGFGRPSMGCGALAIGLSLALSLAALPVAAVLSAAFAVLVGLLWLGQTARRRIGGQTGDVLGAAQQLGEIAALLVLTAALT